MRRIAVTIAVLVVCGSGLFYIRSSRQAAARTAWASTLEEAGFMAVESPTPILPFELGIEALDELLCRTVIRVDLHDDAESGRLRELAKECPIGVCFVVSVTVSEEEKSNLKRQYPLADFIFANPWDPPLQWPMPLPPLEDAEVPDEVENASSLVRDK